MRFSAFFLLAIFALSIRAEGDLFENHSFEEALKQAQSENKLVFVDFYTTWCGPCKMLDKTTWKDDGVKAWLKKHTIPLKINAEVKTKLASKYRIQAYPTLLFVKADGTVASRITGYRKAEQFLKEAKEAISDKDLLAEVEKKYKLDLSADRVDAKTFIKYTDLLTEKGRNEDALKEYIRIMDGAHQDPAKAAISFLAIKKATRLGKVYEPAILEVNKRQAALLDLVETGEISQAQLKLLYSFNLSLKQQDKNLVIYDKMKAHNTDGPLMDYLFNMTYNQLLEGHRFDEILARVSVEDKISEAFTSHERMISLSKDGKEIADRLLVSNLSKSYQLLMGIKKVEEAAQLEEKILKLDQTADTYNSLAWAGYLSGSATDHTLNQAQKAYDLSDGKNAGIIDTYARVLNALGKQKQAIETLESATGFVGRDAKVLKECLEEIKGENNGKTNI